MPISTEEDERAYLQQRVTLYTKVALAIALFFFVGDLVTFPLARDHIAGFDPVPLQARGLAAEVAVIVLLAVATWIGRRAGLTVVSLYLLDGATTILVGAGLSGLVWDGRTLRFHSS